MQDLRENSDTKPDNITSRYKTIKKQLALTNCFLGTKSKNYVSLKTLSL